ncbi:aminoglycoside phosphotransferase family protein [Streptomyces sp. NPDC059853]|uniref:aminoglycoside phosphotransferase family protein n=1 Tax=Streptomyces sp. NPDC059853 TaxID=3346973 RepID=UPI003657A46A
MKSIAVRLWTREGDRFLTRESGLPEIEIDELEDAVPNGVVRAVRKTLGAEVAYLRAFPGGVVETELLTGDFRPPTGFGWRAGELSPPTARRAAWQRPGWLRGALADADRALAWHGIRRRGAPEQMRHTGITGMLRLHTDHEPVWLKAVPDLFAHEVSVVSRLAGQFPGAVPEPLAEGQGWWLARQFPEERGEPREDPLGILADIQIDALGYLSEFASLGCQVRSPEVLAAEITRLAGRDDLLPAPLRRELRAALPRFRVRCAVLGAGDLPMTLVHGDFHADNLRWTGDRWFLYDWTDACIAHPFVDLALPLSYETPAVQAQRLALFVRAWRKVVPDEAVQRCLRAAPAVGAAHQAVTYQAILDDIGGAIDRGNEYFALLRKWTGRLLRALDRSPTAEPVFEREEAESISPAP